MNITETKTSSNISKRHFSLSKTKTKQNRKDQEGSTQKTNKQKKSDEKKKTKKENYEIFEVLRNKSYQKLAESSAFNLYRKNLSC